MQARNWEEGRQVKIDNKLKEIQTQRQKAVDNRLKELTSKLSQDKGPTSNMQGLKKEL